MSIAKKLRHVIDEKKISIYALERSAGMKPSIVQNIIYGRSKNPGIDTLKAIAKALNCHVSDLIEEMAEDNSSSLFQNSLEPWNLSCFVEVLKSLELICAERNLTISQKETFCLAQEIYQYTMHSPSKAVDPTFVRWLLDKKV